MMLTATDLTFRVGAQLIIDEVSLVASGGRMLAVSGPSGAGKSTLLSVLGGLQRPESGRVTLDDAPVADVRDRIGFVLQGYGLIGALTGWENVAITLQSQRIPRRDVRTRTLAVLQQVGLDDVSEHLTDEMSGGQQQRVAVARALAARPDVLLADEPTAELDSENRAIVMALLEQHARTGAIVVIASHDPEVVAHCDDVLHLESGRVVGPGLR